MANKITGGTAQVGGLTAKGKVEAASVKPGTGDAIDKFLENTVAVDPASIGAATRGSVTVSVPGAVVGDIIVMNPPTTLEAGLLFVGAVVSAADTVTIFLYNLTGGAVDGASRVWTYALISKA